MSKLSLTCIRNNLKLLHESGLIEYTKLKREVIISYTSKAIEIYESIKKLSEVSSK